ncbi:hypothetical protein NBRC116596_24300 [Litorivita sp. NS0012-18]
MRHQRRGQNRPLGHLQKGGEAVAFVTLEIDALDGHGGSLSGAGGRDMWQGRRRGAVQGANLTRPRARCKWAARRLTRI